ncbi:MAG TPA: membrane protein insertion efficiency factor YidD [Alphaproteobacteria bacterium]|nr:membrane protein insertion efficiency factor YidD [Alphaproteobacteria bacterium]
MLRKINRFFEYLFLALIKIYKVILSPFLPKACRFMPSCSEYAAEAIKKHGFLKGGFLAIKRLCRCHPWGGSGYDAVP